MNATSTIVRTDQPESGFVTRDGRSLYEVQRLDEMPPFLMTIVGDTDLWMYISSAGAFTAGRVEPDRCVFPYETDDRLHELGGLSGSVTLIRFEGGRIWRPLDPRFGPNSPSRVLRRSSVGDMVEFEETDLESGLRFRVAYCLADRFGVVRRASLELVDGADAVRVELLDGFRNIMPANVPLVLQQQMSTLVDAYKRSEVVGDAGPAVFALEAAISDSPEAKESLRFNTAWHVGLDGASVVLDDGAVASFERGDSLSSTKVVTGRRGAYLCHSAVGVEPRSGESWTLVADAHLDHAAVVELREMLSSGHGIDEEIDRAIADDRDRLASLLAEADGCQLGGDESASAAHQSNVLFNSMRGGVPIDGHRVDPDEFRRFVGVRNLVVAGRHKEFLDTLDGPLDLHTLASRMGEMDDPQLERIALEYLPLTFGRRHGDPSRPWNRYRIRIRDEQGERVTGYEGNWRDIFQNWEATSRSYPAMLPGVISKFLNASTADGYNPYRINEQGIDWEVPEPENPRSGIGYWGDHQIVYLHRLLEQCAEVYPEWFVAMADKAVFSYAEIPYRFRPFDEIAANARSSIVFDGVLDTQLRARVERIGGDGSLRSGEDGSPLLVTLLEKLLVPALAKMSNLVPGGGIWMNTQRPEWNDANNALAGYGLSMVTLYQLRRYADWCESLIASLGEGRSPISDTIADWCENINSVMVRSLKVIDTTDIIDDDQRWQIVESLGRIAERARASLLTDGLGAPVELDRRILVDFFRLTRHFCDRSIATAKRSDGLYESYRVLHLGDGRASVESLSPMLEGQVSILAAGVLSEDEAIGLLDTLFDSELYREDQRTFILYPRKDLPGILERNVIPEDAFASSPLLTEALGHHGWGLVTRDREGSAHFNADLTSHEALQERLASLEGDAEFDRLFALDEGAARRAFERTFGHAQFTGRSGTMHKYEGLGSVYWHMVSKLLLAVQDTAFMAVDRGAPETQVERLRSYYARVRDGLGYRKTPAEFGAIPYEPYSHTPWGMGAQQPGMTGQVKEGVLTRFGELGIRLHGGRIRFEPVLLDDGDLLSEPSVFEVGALELDAGSLGFTLCGVPIAMSLGDEDRIRVVFGDGSTEEAESRELPDHLCRSLFRRDGSIASISVTVRR